MVKNDLLTRGVVEVIEKDHLEKSLQSGKKLRVKFGIDPTAPDLHLGHTVPLRKLRQFQDAGHQAVLIIGDFTAGIGDPSGRDKARPPLSEKDIKNNLKTYLNQAKKVLDMKKVEVHYNSKWLRKMDFGELARLFTDFTVQQMIEREDFSARIKNQKPVWMHELTYPALQAYDSVMVNADLEIGGTDQKFNLLAGRNLMEKRGMKPQDVLTLPLLEGTDGVKKMSKSLGNYIALNDGPNDMYGKIMSISDALIVKYAELLTDLPLEEMAEKVKKDPRAVKMKLAQIIVAMYHDNKMAQKAEEEFVRVVSHKEAPSELESIKLKVKKLTLVNLLVETKMAPSKSEARRLVEQGGVKLDEEKQNDPNKSIELEREILLQVGKRKYLRVSS
ncbi:MAG: tyrosine--tRNA ligase [Candidatus Harrisonbacteria bacterium]|nr:tyrosine--tRNA ligase [Candidatus Harrisonbacteria bacterium]